MLRRHALLCLTVPWVAVALGGCAEAPARVEQGLALLRAGKTVPRPVPAWSHIPMPLDLRSPSARGGSGPPAALSDPTACSALAYASSEGARPLADPRAPWEEVPAPEGPRTVTVGEVEAALVTELTAVVAAASAEGSPVHALCLGVSPTGGGRSAWGTPEGFVVVGLDAVDAHGVPGLRPALAAVLARQLQAAHRSPLLARPDLAAAELEADCLAGVLLGLAGGDREDALALTADPPRPGADVGALPRTARVGRAAAGLELGLARQAGSGEPLPPRSAIRACGALAGG
jgi:hypothetical protein